MKKTLWLFIITISSMAFGQENQIDPPKNNCFKIGFQTGIGWGFKNIDLLEFETINDDNEVVNSGESSISGGGGWHVAISGEYIFNRTVGLGINLGYQSSSLRPVLDNAKVRFLRYTFQPTLKYLIGINPQKDKTINLGIGYGFYSGGKLKLDAGEVDLTGILEYDNTSGIHLLAEYEFIGPKKFGFVTGVRYYGVDYDSKQTIGVSDFDPLKGSGIDLYMGINYYL